jgi:hypothetical protein
VRALVGGERVLIPKAVAAASRKRMAFPNPWGLRPVTKRPPFRVPMMGQSSHCCSTSWGSPLEGMKLVTGRRSPATGGSSPALSRNLRLPSNITVGPSTRKGAREAVYRKIPLIILFSTFKHGDLQPCRFYRTLQSHNSGTSLRAHLIFLAYNTMTPRDLLPNQHCSLSKLEWQR